MDDTTTLKADDTILTVQNIMESREHESFYDTIYGLAVWAPVVSIATRKHEELGQFIVYGGCAQDDWSVYFGVYARQPPVIEDLPEVVWDELRRRLVNKTPAFADVPKTVADALLALSGDTTQSKPRTFKGQCVTPAAPPPPEARA